MPPSRTADSPRSRRDPISCQSCRAKKLRCDRQQPCGNCRSRQISCDYYGDRHTPRISLPAVQDHIDLYAQNDELRARIERLERAMLGESPAGIARGSPPATTVPATSAVDQKANGATVDSQWLEDIGTHFVEANGLALELPPITVHNSNDFLYKAEYLPRTRPVSLPSRRLALECLDLYEVDIDLVHPIVHIPSVRSMINKVYDKLDEGHRVDQGSMALILIICGCVSLWELHDSFESDSNNSTRPCEVLATQALIAVDNAHVTSQGSIEAVQACILICFHFCHMEGFSPHTRGLAAQAFTMARSLGLHKIDAPSGQPRGISQAGVIKAEVGRKVWWHLAATDWLFGYTSGFHEGTYSIHPEHMTVKMPRNLDHDDLSVCDSTFARADEEPTIMSYFLQRVKLAVIGREIMDALAGSSINYTPRAVPYDRIIALDTKYCGLLASLPKQFQLDQALESIGRCGKASLGAMWLVRTTIHVFLDARRCKLHLPYLLRVKSDPRYAYSREICLKSARRVFQARGILLTDEPTGTHVAFFHLGGTLIHIFYAAMVLVMDLCVNSEGEAKDRERLEEVQHAIEMMQNARASSKFVARFLDSMMQVLRKHQVSLPTKEPLHRTMMNGRVAWPATPDASNGLRSPLSQSHHLARSHEVVYNNHVIDGHDGFGEVWQDYLYNGSSLDVQSWDALINDLEMRFE